MLEADMIILQQCNLARADIASEPSVAGIKETPSSTVISEFAALL
jgi:hypothetical protein